MQLCMAMIGCSILCCQQAEIARKSARKGKVPFSHVVIQSSIRISTPARCADAQVDLQAEAGRAQRIEITARMDELLGDGVALLLPAATSAAPRLSLSSEETDPIWKSLAKLTAAAGLARLPQARAALRLFKAVCSS